MKTARQNVVTFRGLMFPFNPSELKLEDARRVRRDFLPEAGETVRDLGEGARRISGSGTFFGENAAENYIKLQREYSRGGEGELLLPGFCPMKAVFFALRARAAGRDVMYEFEFVRTDAAKPACEKAGYYMLGEGESLWDVSAKLEIPLCELTACNPQYASPFAPTAGERVRLP